MTWVAVAIGGSALVGGVLGSRSSSQAANAQTRASDQAISEQQREFDLTRQDLGPYLNIGRQAINTLGNIYGYTPYQPPTNSMVGTTPTAPQTINFNGLNVPADWFGLGVTPPGLNVPTTVGGATTTSGPPATQTQPATQPDYSAFYASPDYNFRRSEGLRDITNSFAARGGALSGNALRALTDYNSNLASGEFGNWWERQARLAGIGGAATNTAAQVGQGTAANIGNALIGAGNARASGITGSAGAWNNAIQGGIGNALLYRNLGGGSGMDEWMNKLPWTG